MESARERADGSDCNRTRAACKIKGYGNEGRFCEVEGVACVWVIGVIESDDVFISSLIFC